MIRLITWDHRERIDLVELRQALADLTGQTLRLHEVDTGSDQYAVVLATEPLDQEQVDRVYRVRWES